MVACSPLTCGILSGKYDDDLPGGSRATLRGFEWISRAVLLDADVRAEPATSAATATRNSHLYPHSHVYSITCPRAAGASEAAAAGVSASASASGLSSHTAGGLVEDTYEDRERDREQEARQRTEHCFEDVQAASSLHAKLRLLAAVAERLSCSLAQLAIGALLSAHFIEPVCTSKSEYSL